jgi:16S rRNA (adenine(1408)-N(1))-methyltransferase
LDASPDALSDGAWRAKRAGAANIAFLVEGIARIPNELAAVANEVTVHFPWGSLLDGLVDADPAVLRPLASLLRPGGELRVLLSATARDGYPLLTPETVAALADGYADHGLRFLAARWASPTDVAAARSGWAKRLRVGDARTAILARYRRADPVEG